MAVIEQREHQQKDKEGNTKLVKKYKATVTVKGFQRTSKTFDRKTDAQDWAQKIEYEYKNQLSFGESAYRTKTVREVLERYSQSLKQSNPARHKIVQPQLDWWNARIGEIKLGELSKDLILRQRDKIKDKHVKGNPDASKVSNSWANRVMGMLSRALNVATEEWGWLAKNPMEGIKKFPEPAGRTRFLQDDELERLLTAARLSDNADMEAVIVLAVTTGMRVSEIRKIRIKDVDFELRKILLPTSKNKKPRLLHIADPALALLQKIKDRAQPGQQYIFASPQDVSKYCDFRRAWRTIIKRSGLEDFHFHDLRHSAASFLAMHGAGLHQIAEVLGHSSFQVTKRYVHLIEKNTSSIVEATAAKVFKNEKKSQTEKTDGLEESVGLAKF